MAFVKKIVFALLSVSSLCLGQEVINITHKVSGGGGGGAVLVGASHNNTSASAASIDTLASLTVSNGDFIYAIGLLSSKRQRRSNRHHWFQYAYPN